MDPFANQSVSRSSPAVDVFAITTNDDEDLAVWARSILVENDGDITITTPKGSVVTIPVFAGWNPVGARRVHETGTTVAGRIFGAV